MRVFVASTSTNNVHTVIGSLIYTQEPTRPLYAPLPENIQVFHYDQKWNQAAAQACQGNPENQKRLQAGQLHFPRERVGMDDELVRSAEAFKPDLILFIGAWEGPGWLPLDETLKKLRSIAPSIHLLFDGADQPWWNGDDSHGNIFRFEKNGCFDLTVNIDGSHKWPGGQDWHGPERINGLTLLTPLDPRAFMGPPESPPFKERPYAIAYAGNAGGYIRNYLVQRVQHAIPGFAVKLRDDHPLSYKQYCDFLRMCRVVINVPFTGSMASKHVKGRVLEAAYAGCCLLEWKNDATASWFTPRSDYWEYSSVEECIDMAQFLAGHPQLCEDMAKSLNDMVLREHSPNVFWRTVFDAVSVKQESKLAEAAD